MTRFFCAALALLALYATSCTSTGSKSDGAVLKQALLETAQKQSPGASFAFQLTETDSSIGGVLRNKAVGQRVSLGKRDTSVVLGYYVSKARGAAGIDILKSTLLKRDTVVSVQITDLAGKILETFSPTEKVDDFHDLPPGGGFDDLGDCLDHFFLSEEYCRLLAIANRECRTVYTAVLCCLKSGDCFYIEFLAIHPTRFCPPLSIYKADLPIVFHQ